MPIDPRIALSFNVDGETFERTHGPMRPALYNYISAKANPSVHNLPSDVTLAGFGQYVDLLKALSNKDYYPIGALSRNGTYIYRGNIVPLKRPADFDILGLNISSLNKDDENPETVKTDFVDYTTFRHDENVGLQLNTPIIPAYIGSFKGRAYNKLDPATYRPQIVVLAMLPKRKYLLVLGELGPVRDTSYGAHRFVINYYLLLKHEGKIISCYQRAPYLIDTDPVGIAEFSRVTLMTFLGQDIHIVNPDFDICHYGLTIEEVKGILGV